MSRPIRRFVLIFWSRHIFWLSFKLFVDFVKYANSIFLEMDIICFKCLISPIKYLNVIKCKNIQFDPIWFKSLTSNSFDWRLFVKLSDLNVLFPVLFCKQEIKNKKVTNYLWCEKVSGGLRYDTDMQLLRLIITTLN